MPSALSAGCRGRVVVGKTSLSELAWTSHAHKALFGMTSNPWGHAHSAGGSSGGSAATIAASMAPPRPGATAAVPSSSMPPATGWPGCNPRSDPCHPARPPTPGGTSSRPRTSSPDGSPTPRSPSMPSPVPSPWTCAPCRARTQAGRTRWSTRTCLPAWPGAPGSDTPAWTQRFSRGHRTGAARARRSGGRDRRRALGVRARTARRLASHRGHLPRPHTRTMA